MMPHHWQLVPDISRQCDGPEMSGHIPEEQVPQSPHCKNLKAQKQNVNPTLKFFGLNLC
jgi:hypothetical protein